jgi:hypothetical protein
VVVWDASLDTSLCDYAQQYCDRLQAAVPSSAQPLPLVVVCNKTDSAPCPLPQIEALHERWPFIAVSAERATNTRLLWEMVCSRLTGGPAAEPPPRIKRASPPGGELHISAPTRRTRGREPPPAARDPTSPSTRPSSSPYPHRSP